MDDLLADFVAETREMLEASGGEIVAWEADPSDRARLDTIFRFVHTVKGNCGFFDFPHLEKLSHAAEDHSAKGWRASCEGTYVPLRRVARALHVFEHLERNAYILRLFAGCTEDHVRLLVR